MSETQGNHEFSNPRQLLSKEIVVMSQRIKDRAGKVKYGILAWLVGLPLPIVVLLMFYRGCDF